MKLHNPRLISIEGKLHVRFNTKPKPVYAVIPCTFLGLSQKEIFDGCMEDWLKTEQTIPVSEDSIDSILTEVIPNFNYKKKLLNYIDRILKLGIPLPDHIAERLEVICKGCDRDYFKPLGVNNKVENYLACCPDNNYEIRLKPLPTEDSQDEVWNEFLMNAPVNLEAYVSWVEEIKQKYKLTKIK